MPATAPGTDSLPDTETAARGAAIEMLQRHSLTSLVLDDLQQRIVAGELPGGAKLNETEIAARLRVSRGPVREAFRALEQSGLVRTEKNRGVFVRELSLGEADQIYEVRAALEGLIGRLAAARIGAAALKRLRGIVRRMKLASRSRDVEAYFPLNIEFHEVLAEAAGNAALRATYRRVVDELRLFRRATLSGDVANTVASANDHAAIFEAVAAGDAQLAAQLQFDHVIDSRARLHAALGLEPPAELTRFGKATAGALRRTPAGH